MARSVRVNRASVTLKYAQTLDGRIATSTGHSRWISGPEARVRAHRLRAEHDAVLVGIGTVIADDPLLTVRDYDGPDPLRVVADSKLRIPLTAALLNDGNPTVVVTTTQAPADRAAALRSRGARIITVADEDGAVDLSALLSALWSESIRTVLVEGGGAIITSLLSRRLVDRVAIVIAPRIVGTGLDALGNLGIDHMGHALTLDDLQVEAVGEDLLVQGSVHWPELTGGEAAGSEA